MNEYPGRGPHKRSKFETDTQRQRNKQNLIILEYVVGRAMLKGLQLRSSRIASMGLPQSDAHYFYPEEAVWLMECAMGSVVHNGIALSVQQGYRLLESHGITWPQYAVYCYLKCAGYVVLPYNRITSFEHLNTTHLTAVPTASTSNAIATDENRLKFPSDLLQKFPTMTRERRVINCDIVSKNDSPITKIFNISETFPTSANRFFKIDRKHIHREYVRPRYWPRFDAIAKNSSNWVIYRAERAKLLNKNKTVSAPPASPFPNHFNNDAQLKPFLPSSSASLWNANALGIDLDYSVYAGDGSYKHTLAVTPLFLILVVNKNIAIGGNLLPSSAYLHAVSAQLNGERLVLAIANYGSVLFYDIDHRPIQL